MSRRAKACKATAYNDVECTCEPRVTIEVTVRVQSNRIIHINFRGEDDTTTCETVKQFTDRVAANVQAEINRVKAARP